MRYLWRGFEKEEEWDQEVGVQTPLKIELSDELAWMGPLTNYGSSLKCDRVTHHLASCGCVEGGERSAQKNLGRLTEKGPERRGMSG
jgi:hypothetical protein